jgi:RHS repeat-associated protein
MELDIYGKVHTFAGRSLSDCPFRWQGQYEDSETGLYYNRFRYYSPEEGMYLSQDPIGLAGGDKLYAYVHDVNSWVDIWGLSVVEGQVGAYGDLVNTSDSFDGFQIHHIPQDKLGYLPRKDGIAVIMTDADHAKTRTFKTKGRTTAAIDKNRAFKDVLKDDLIDLHKIGGGKFDNSIKQIIKKYEDLGKLKKGELSLNKIKKSCL